MTSYQKRLPTCSLLLVLVLLGSGFSALSASESSRPICDGPGCQRPDCDCPLNEPLPNPEAPGDELVAVEPAFLVNVAVDREDGRYQDGQTLSVRFQVEEASYVYLLYHQVDGRCLMLFPNQAQPENHLPARREVRIPAAGESFRFRIRPPFGEEALQVLASTEPIPELDALDSSVGRAVLVTDEVLDLLSQRTKQRPEVFGEHRVRIETFAAEKLPGRAPPARVGLFVGVNRYANQTEDEGDAPFRGSAELFAATMVEKCELDGSRVKVLTDSQATKSNFQTAITKWLPAVTQPGDVVFIYYVGHGGQIQNQDGSEQDGLDEFLTFYDTVEDPEADWDSEMRQKGMTDDALARCLQALPGRQIVLLTDTCHGGGLVDARGMTRLFSEEAQRVRDISGLNVVVITGSLPDEVVLFDPTAAMTYLPAFFIDAIETLPKPLTVAAAFEHYRTNLGPFMAQRFPDFASQYRFAQEPLLVDTALLPIYLVPPDP